MENTTPTVDPKLWRGLAAGLLVACIVVLAIYGGYRLTTDLLHS